MGDDYEAMRLAKDLEIKKLVVNLEEQRVSYETTLNQKIVIIQQLTQKLLEQDSEILSLKTILTRKNDVEE
jgi:hypothetical protein